MKLSTLQHRIARAAGVVLAVVSVLSAPLGFAGEQEDYNRRGAERDVAAFQALDRDGNGQLTIEEVRGDIDMEARFSDIDINRDGIIIVDELNRYIASRYRVTVAAPGR